MQYYKAFGLIIAADIPIREFIKIEETTPEVFIRAGVVPPLEGRHPNKIVLPIKNIAHFLIQQGNEIIYQREAVCDDDNLRLFLLGSAMGALLQQRGLVVLHGNAVSFDGQTASVFIGHQGAGKSTMATLCFSRGAHILADDVCAIFLDSDGKPWVIPSYPQIKIWQNTADLLRIDTSTLPRIRKGNDKYALNISAQFQTEPLMLKEVFEIDSHCQGVKEMSGIEKFKLLVTHSYRFRFLRRMACDQAYLKQLIQLSWQITVKKRAREVLSITEAAL